MKSIGRIHKRRNIRWSLSHLWGISMWNNSSWKLCYIITFSIALSWNLELNLDVLHRPVERVAICKWPQKQNNSKLCVYSTLVYFFYRVTIKSFSNFFCSWYFIGSLIYKRVTNFHTTQLIPSLIIVGKELFVCKENNQKCGIGERKSYSETRRENFFQSISVKFPCVWLWIIEIFSSFFPYLAITSMVLATRIGCGGSFFLICTKQVWKQQKFAR